jgi:hypothetical protein
MHRQGLLTSAFSIFISYFHHAHITSKDFKTMDLKNVSGMPSTSLYGMPLVLQFVAYVQQILLKTKLFNMHGRRLPHEKNEETGCKFTYC